MWFWTAHMNLIRIVKTIFRPVWKKQPPPLFECVSVLTLQGCGVSTTPGCFFPSVSVRTSFSGVLSCQTADIKLSLVLEKTYSNLLLMKRVIVCEVCSPLIEQNHNSSTSNAFYNTEGNAWILIVSYFISCTSFKLYHCCSVLKSLKDFWRLWCSPSVSYLKPVTQMLATSAELATRSKLSYIAP